MRKIFLIPYLLLTLLIALPRPARAQEKADSVALEVVRAMMERRVWWRIDTTEFIACSIYEKLGRPANLAERLGPVASSLLDSPVNPCDARTRSESDIALVSVAVADTTAEVILLVHRGANSYVEKCMMRLSERDGWTLTEIRTSGWGAY